MWEIELKLIESLGKLYPIIYDDYGDIIMYKDWQKNNCDRVWWVYWLCAIQLNQRLLNLEKFMEKNNTWMWYNYKDCFNITDEQCGKKS